MTGFWKHDRMSLELILGPMFAGKSSAIQSIVRRHRVLGWPVCVITHTIDTRYSTDSVLVNHDQQSIPAIRSSVLLPLIDTPEFKESKLLVVEEAQFFSDLVPFVLSAVEKYQKHVVVVGLDGDAERCPFGRVLDLIPLCDKVTKLTAFCTDCGDSTPAIFTYSHIRNTDESTNIHVGGAEIYSALCRKHFMKRKLAGLEML